MAETPSVPTPRQRASFTQDFRRFFLRGLALILPPILTVLILLYLWDLLNRKVGEPTNYLIRTIAAVFVQESRTERPESQQDQWVGLTRDRNGREIAPFVPRVDYELVHDKTHATDKIPQTVLGFQNPVLAFYERYIHYRYWEPYRLKYIGLVVAVVFVYFIGHFLATFIGNSLWRAAEHTVFRLPIVRAVYPTVKEVIDFFLSEQRREYNRVVAVEYPRRGIWSLGLVTGESFRDLERSTGRELLTIFIPYTPYSVTGYVITVPRAEVLDLNISVEDAIRFVMSGGVISPNGRNALPAQPSATLPTPPSAPVSAEAGQPHSASHPAVGNSPDLIGARSSHEPASHNPGSHGSRPIRVGTRGSQLARAQADWVLAQLRKLAPGRGVELVEIRTGGDRAAEARLREIGGEGLFTKEIQNALMANEVDIAVHSLKDLPTAAVPGLVVAAVPPRAPALDVLVSPQFRDWRSLPLGARVGTSSPRRRGQLLRLRGDLVIEEIRGNVPTRLKKIDELGLAAVVLAHAGLQRLGLEASVTHHFTADEMLPAPGQGALAIECRSDDCELLDLLRPLDDPATHFATAAERAVLATLRGGCHMPLGSYATAAADQLGLRAGVFATDGRRAVLDFIAGDVHHAESLGRELAERLLAAGAAGLS